MLLVAAVVTGVPAFVWILRDKEKGSSGRLHRQQFALQERTTALHHPAQETQIFYSGQEIYLTFAQRDILLHLRVNTFPFCSRRKHSFYLLRISTILKSLKRNSGIKKQHLFPQDMHKMQESLGNCLSEHLE